jgi:hypothetical protein
MGPGAVDVPQDPPTPVGGDPGGDRAGVTEIVDGDVTWRFDDAFLTSRWTCLWGRGCLGIHEVPTPELGEGCCSVGAELDGTDEAMRIAALADTLSPDRFQFHAEAAAGGVFARAIVADGGPAATRVVEGACIFLNRPGFDGGAGCALHLAAVDADESALDWKPSVCWQLPLRVTWSDDGHGGEVAEVRGWRRADWGPEGETMAWCCTEGDLAYVGGRPVVESLAEELDALVGTPVYVELRRRLADG